MSKYRWHRDRRFLRGCKKPRGWRRKMKIQLSRNYMPGIRSEFIRIFMSVPVENPMAHGLIVADTEPKP